MTQPPIWFHNDACALLGAHDLIDLIIEKESHLNKWKVSIRFICNNGKVVDDHIESEAAIAFPDLYCTTAIICPNCGDMVWKRHTILDEDDFIEKAGDVVKIHAKHKMHKLFRAIGLNWDGNERAARKKNHNDTRR